MNPITLVITAVSIVVITLAIIAFIETQKSKKQYKNTPSQDRNDSEVLNEVVNAHGNTIHQGKSVGNEAGETTSTDVSETVLKLIDSGKISWPESVSDRNKFITEKFGKIWDALLDININANVAVFSNIDIIDKLADIGYVSYDENNSASAWEALSEVLMLVLILEDALGIDITPLSKYDVPNEPTDISNYIAKIRSRIRT